MRLSSLVIPLSLFIASTSVALPPGAAKRGLREGANHHTGDDSFVAQFGRAPRPDDDEKVRMRVHFKAVRAWLASRPATRPELKAKRAQLLGYLDEYIAKGITPKNIDLAWRTPVFIDNEQTICAVGYLIERSAGRALPEKIAATHRFSYIEDIAKVMPEVEAWVAASGLTLDEIASIQPGYEGPEIDQYQRWALKQMKNGPYADTESGFAIAGRFRLQQMHGAWTKTEEEGGAVRGSGTFAMGSGKWRSNYKTGARMAEGLFANSQPTGKWRFYHPSGNLAAEGNLEGATRGGVWRFYHDTTEQTMFAKGNYTSRDAWEYYDEAGTLVVSTTTGRPKAWAFGSATLVSVEPGADRIQYKRHAGRIQETDEDMPDSWGSKLESYTLDGVRIFAYEHELRDDDRDLITATYDADGNRLQKVDGVWHASDCKWSAARKQIARSEDLSSLHGLLTKAGTERCGDVKPVSSERAKQIDSLLATRKTARAPVPAFVEQIADYENDAPDPDDEVVADDVAAAEAEEEVTEVADLVSFVANGPSNHFDTRFIQVYRTIAGTRNQME